MITVFIAVVTVSMEPQSAATSLRVGSRIWRLAVINGANMSNLIHRDPGRFGTAQSIEELEESLVKIGCAMGLKVLTVHSNSTGAIIDWLSQHAFGPDLDGILINPAGWTNYAEHVRHCLEESRLPYIEVHFANIAVTGHHSVFTKTAVGICHGFRKHSYTAALLAMANILDDPDFPKPTRRHPLPN